MADAERLIGLLMSAPLPQRALILSEWLDAREGNQPRKARAPALHRKMTGAEAAGVVYRECFCQILANVRYILHSDDPEGPHQLRVGLRRLRTALRLFGEPKDEGAQRGLESAARWLGLEVGELRDLDVVFLEMLQPAAHRTPQEPGFAPLLAATDRRRVEVREQLRGILLQDRAVDFMLGLLALFADQGEIAAGDPMAEPIADLAPDLLNTVYARARKRGRKIHRLNPEQRHALRKALKVLRYAIELLAPLYSDAIVKRTRKSLATLQDSFGALNDTLVLEHLFLQPEAPAADQPSACRAAGRVIGWNHYQAVEEWQRVATRWRRFRKTKPFWH